MLIHLTAHAHQLLNSFKGQTSYYKGGRLMISIRQCAFFHVVIFRFWLSVLLNLACSSNDNVSHWNILRMEKLLNNR